MNVKDLGMASLKLQPNVCLKGLQKITFEVGMASLLTGNFIGNLPIIKMRATNSTLIIFQE
jgi:hypothetical protein